MVKSVYHMSYCHYSPYQGTRKVGHRGPSCSLVPNVFPNKNPCPFIIIYPTHPKTEGSDVDIWDCAWRDPTKPNSLPSCDKDSGLTTHSSPISYWHHVSDGLHLGLGGTCRGNIWSVRGDV